MSIQTRCPNCEASYTLAEAQRGKKVRCRKCSDTFVVGEDKAKAPAASAPKSANVRRDALQASPAPPPRTPPPRTKPAPVRRDRDGTATTTRKRWRTAAIAENAGRSPGRPCRSSC